MFQKIKQKYLIVAHESANYAKALNVFFKLTIKKIHCTRKLLFWTTTSYQ
jgi:hypothetical protein